jgi:UrcA family protein
MKRSVVVALAGLAVATVAQGAYAKSADAVVVRNVVVRYGDLNLGAAQGEASLHERIVLAAAQACGGNPIFSSNYRDAPRYVTRTFEQCRAKAVSEALTEVYSRQRIIAR